MVSYAATKKIAQGVFVTGRSRVTRAFRLIVPNTPYVVKVGGGYPYRGLDVEASIGRVFGL